VNIVIDIGNTTAKVAVFDRERLIEVFHQSNQSLDGLPKIISKYPVSQGIFASVIDLNWIIKSQLRHLPIQITSLSNIPKLPIINLYKSPETLGDDRLAAVVGANAELPGKDILVIDAGTAITYDLINAAGEYIGGNISPGKSLRFRALHRFTSHLPLIDENGEIPMIGKETPSAIRAGVITGIKHEMIGYIEEFKQVYPDLYIFLTGGDGIHFEEELKGQVKSDKYLVLKGLNRILNYNEEV
jgi:type III pantothenate kinase